ncbi:DNA polymerase III subunit gamma and tau [Pseudarthrobacter sp. J1763]|uniref:DNA polymerase III subunit gamma and tau n=1 Tax=Pseudarthrobacter sp. J1763 TaxID=3420445 RepID=UPI003D2C6778
MTVTTALYRRYRPDSFADVIGQEHVTEPLMTALRKNRVNHAYLFSGPRGCGKTTSARILARCLNCAEGPTDTPCGKCPSCVELARGGSGSLDVIEIDAASHGGVDDARDLRERATFAPVRDRYKIFIIDEAHMVTPQGFNALLKIVEEPPEHIKFIFATTEPDKVIGTIRSRTHHYPFRLVPPEPLMAYLELLCQQENVPVAPGVLSLVVRAGGGSVRDSLSVLDQLMAGAGEDGLNYELAVALLGYTHASLLDDVVDAVAAGDSGTVFRAVDRVIQTGHDPRRFVEDLLERFRDLIIVQAMPESAAAILRGMPADQIARMRTQAQNLGAAELSRAADVTNTALTDMTGATSPRLHLELLCARILLPGADQSERGSVARIDRLERRLAFSGNDAGTATTSPAPQAPATSGGQGPAVREVQRPAVAEVQAHAATETNVPAAQSAQAHAVVEPVAAEAKPVVQEPAAPAADHVPAQVSAQAASANKPQLAPAQPPAQAPAQAPASSQAGGSGQVEMMRRAWPEVLDTLSKIKRSTWALVAPNAQVGGFDGEVLQLAFTTSGLAGAFSRGDHSENLRRAISQVVGVDCQITPIAGATNGGSSSEPNPKAPASREAPADAAPLNVAAAPVQQNLVEPASVAPEVPSPEFSAANPAPAVEIVLDDWGLPVAAAVERPAETTAPHGTLSREESAADDDEPQVAASWASTPYDDVPYADEEPPNEDDLPPEGWTPPAPRSLATSQAAATVPASEPASEPAPAKQATTKPVSKLAAAKAKLEESGNPGSGVPNKDDPWERAREQSPGVWIVGTESNVGTQAVANAAEPIPLATTNYAPATAQYPTPAAPAPTPSSTAAPTPVEPTPESGNPGPRPSLYQRLSNSPEAQAARLQAAPNRTASAPQGLVDEYTSADDVTIEESGLFGRAAVERILGGTLVAQLNLDGSPVIPR